MKLLCMPGGGTPALSYNKWITELGEGWEIIILEYPGRGCKRKEPSMDSMEEIAENLYKEVSNIINDDEPYFMVSSCIGVMVMYELYQKIKTSKMAQPQGLFIFSAATLNSGIYKNSNYLSIDHKQILDKTIDKFFRADIFQDTENIKEKYITKLIEKNTTNEQFIPVNIEELTSESTFEQQISLDFINDTVKMLVNDWKMASKYCNKPHLELINIPIVVTFAKNDELLSLKDIDKWEQYTSEDYTFIEMQGNHNLVTDYPKECCQIIKQQVKRIMNETEVDYLINVWKKVLKNNEISRNSNFFALGGSSMEAMEISSRIFHDKGKRISIYDIFESSSLYDLSVILKEKEQLKEETVIKDSNSQSNMYEEFSLTDVQYAYWYGENIVDIKTRKPTYSYFEIIVEKYSLIELEDALNKVIKKQPMLRVVVDNNAMQKIQEKDFYVHIESKMCDTEEQWEQECIKQKTLSQYKMNSGNSVLWQVTATIYNERICLHILANSVVFDGKSLFLFLDEWKQFLDNPMRKCEPYKFSFRDFVISLKNEKNTEQYLQDKKFAISKMEEYKNLPQLPVNRENHKTKNKTISHHERKITKDQWEKFTNICQQNKVTPNAALLTIYTQILALYGNKNRFSINFTCFNRDFSKPELSRLIGDFTSLLLVPVDIEGCDFLHQVSETQKNVALAMEHKRFGTIEVARYLSSIEGSEKMNFPIVFTSMVGMDNDLKMPGTLRNLETETAMVWLDLQVISIQDSVYIRMETFDDVLSYSMAEEMINAYEKTFLLLLNEEMWSVKRPILFQNYDLGLREECNKTQTEVVSCTLDELFVKSVKKYPEHPAIIDGNRVINYQKLYNDAYSLCKKLKNETGTYVGIMLSRGYLETVAILGIIMAGKAYVPIDPNSPIERTKKIVSHLDSNLVLVDNSTLSKVEIPYIKKMCLCEEEDSLKYDPDDYISITKPSSIAYVIFTSGSTGEPKGVVISHKSVLNTILDVNHRFQVTKDDRTLGLSNSNFDLSVYDIWGMLIVGGAKVIVSEIEKIDPEKWCQLIEKNNVTITNSVPTFWEMSVEYLNGSDNKFITQHKLFNKLRLIMMSGDKVNVSLVKKIKKLNKQIKIVALGGATECGIWSNYYEAENLQDSWGIVPYGYPLSNQKFHILNENKEDCPNYVVGKMYISGDSLAEGYINDPNLTKDKFFLHFGKNEMLYDTGDLGCYWQDGTIEFIGRIDSQVKIRGHRIELGEIENALERIEGVAHAIVVLANINGTSKLMSAIQNDCKSLTDEEYICYLRKTLPQYMIPDVFMNISQMPITGNGKVDRKKLKNMLETYAKEKIINDQRLNETTDFTPSQNMIVQLWKEILGCTPQNINSEFYEDGGDSLKMIRFVNRFNELITNKLTLEKFMSGTTVEELANAYDELRK